MDVFVRQGGYATPKMDVRAAVFREDRILMVQERSDGLWTLPGGFADVGDSPSVRRRARSAGGIRISRRATRLVALLDRNRHPHPPFGYHLWKAFFLCELQGGEARASIETSAAGSSPRTPCRPCRRAASASAR